MDRIPPAPYNAQATRQLITGAQLDDVCKICGGPAPLVRKSLIRFKHEAALHACPRCGFASFQPAGWLGEAYVPPITAPDVGYVMRNHTASQVIAKFLDQYALSTGPYVDYGGGYGMLVRLMRDAGYKFHLYEPMTQNLFAPNLAADVSRFGPYELATAIEVFEHLPDPVGDLEQILKLSSRVLFTTEIYPGEGVPAADWHYLGEEHGQHVSFHTERSLQVLGERFGLFYRRLAPSWHLLAPAGEQDLFKPEPKPEWHQLWLRKMSKKVFRAKKRPRRESLTLPDHEAIRAHLTQIRSATPAADFHLDSPKP
jgi:hypothetical protein